MGLIVCEIDRGDASLLSTGLTRTAAGYLVLAERECDRRVDLELRKRESREHAERRCEARAGIAEQR